MTFEIRNREVEKTLKEIGQVLRSQMPEGYGFALLIANYGHGGATFYTSSFEREDTCNVLRELIRKLENHDQNRGPEIRKR